MRGLIVLLFSVLTTLSVIAPATAQDMGVPVSSILTLDSERLFAESQFGERVTRDIEAEQSILRAENRQMEAKLVEEERVLTEKRKEMTPEDFRAVADAFDARVEEIRRFQDNKASEIAQFREREEAAFVLAARPVLEDLMREARASIILEQRVILMSSNSVNITETAIARLNAAIGDGSSLNADPE
ncbi:OmpH family outer membrane protein [Shimia sp.]|uniref:OmpH family outer membrane protein n=1 Tax=Shimia sp. TaxID=1954381 RepID=UPI00329A3408